jgi:hypothetical protein
MKAILLGKHKPERNMLDEAVKDGCHVYTKMGMVR